jgi:hypothetical protein
VKGTSHHPGARIPPTAGILLLVGGVLAVGGAFLPWATASVAGVNVTDVSGVDRWDGWIVLGSGLAAIVTATLAFVGRPHVRPILVGSSACAGGLCVALGSVAAADARGRIVDALAASSTTGGSTPGQARAIAEQALRLGFADASVSGGVYVAIAGGMLLLAAAALVATSGTSSATGLAAESTAGRSPSRHMDVTSTPPAGSTGEDGSSFLDPPDGT